MTQPTDKPQIDVPTSTPAPGQAFFGIQRIFLKGQSIELPLGSKLFLESGAPTMNLAIQVASAELSPGIYESNIRATLSSQLGDKTLFLLEVDQAGIFEVRDVSAAQLADILEIGSPTILAPYLRAQIADVLTRATLPAFYMPEINWPVLAMERRTQLAAGIKEVPVTLH